MTDRSENLSFEDTIQGFRHPAGCVSPKTVGYQAVDGSTQQRWVRCRQCLPCRIIMKQSWVGRCLLELTAQLGKARFLTLTYAPEFCPSGLRSDHLRDFLKRYRYHYGPCRFIAVGEYGEAQGRPHYHAIIFGHFPEVIGPWHNNLAWGYGYSYDGAATKESISYVAGYTLKNMMKADKPLIRVSRRPGIGFTAIDLMARVAPRVLRAWPARYVVSGRTYPLVDGGQARFQRSYLEAGGSPPVNPNPDPAYCVMADNAKHDLGTRLLSERHRSYELRVRNGQEGLPKKTRERL